MTMLSIAAGVELPIILFAEDEATGLYPKAVIRQDDGTVIDTINLTHQVNGIYVYTGAAILMPVIPFVTVQFTIFTDVAQLIESLRYKIQVDSYILDTITPAIKAKTDSMTYNIANELDVNVQSQNDAPMYGNGTPASKWRGYP